ncbi:MAG: putative hydrolase of the HAD superfamily [Idiomarinaceae bacterium HL-53]|nr:MAG: putative hydrolase of the HAD superfamily [Idiomarinaceae bacterium HL-53]CUS47894.1 putative hydrolase of the HAD superfamily [Idiomarinaceae bacterium HL-53]
MQYHRRIEPIHAISFDLDDTLYENIPVMQRAEQHVADFIAKEWPQTASFDRAAWRQLRDQVAASDPVLASDMTALRLATLEQGMSRFGVDDVKVAAQAAMDEFLVARNQVEIAPEIHQLLADLAAKYPLVAVSNGNADIHRIGLGDYFVAAFHPGNGLRGKPYPDMFRAAYQRLGLTHPNQLLHVGDHPISDVHGALEFGAQAAWYVPSGHRLQTAWLPHLSIREVTALRDLL